MNILQNSGATSVVPSWCHMCQQRCQTNVRVGNGVLRRIEGRLQGWNGGRLCPRGNSGIMFNYDPNRVRTPLRRTNPEKGLGVDPKFEPITWDQALDLMAEKLGQTRANNPYGLRVGSHDNSRTIPLQAFALAFGAPQAGPGAGTSGGVSCGQPIHGLGPVVHGSFVERLDWKHSNLVMLWGNSGAFEGFYDLSWDAAQSAEARLRGMKLVVVDPRFSVAASKADEWVPIRPGTDAALALGMINVMLNELGIYDAPFIKKYTNGPYLIGPDGYYVRDPATGKPLVWDPARGKAATFDDELVSDLALEGEYDVNGLTCKPSFQLLKEHVGQYSPQKVLEITTVPADTVRRLARLWGEEARVGATLVLEGKEFPWRPVAFSFYRGVNAQKRAVEAAMALETMAMIVGAIDVPGSVIGVSGGSMFSAPHELHADKDGLLVPPGHSPVPPAPFKWPPSRTDLKELFPLTYHEAHVHHITALEPDRFGLNSDIVNIQHFSNPFSTMADPQTLARSFQNTYNIVCDVVLSETAQFADIFVPEASYLETHHVVRPSMSFQGAVLLQPAVESLNGMPDFLDTMVSLAERLGILYGQGGMNHWLNMLMDLKKPYVLDLNKKYKWVEMLDLLFKGSSNGERDLDWFRRNGAMVEESGPSKYMPWRKARLPLYMEFIKSAGEKLQKSLEENQVEQRTGVHWDFSDYQPFPSWRPGPIHQAQPGYDMYAISYKTVLCTHGRGANNPWLMELMEKDPYALKLMINTATAKRNGIRDGDAIWVESPVTRVLGVAALTEGIHPECVGFAGALGHWAPHSIAKGKGAHFNSLCALTLDNTDAVSGALGNASARVKVYKASAEDVRAAR
ncbi:MAG: molybdopterin-dependent oxidoreductase [Chloroflexi bacterium]|nr:molybdopterin-dependent oxidoreductase [Chloroflexota bacterium]